MSWKYTEKGEYPFVYKTGHWDGKASDLVLAEDINGNHFVAQFYEGFMDGHSFSDWYFVDSVSKKDWLVESVVRWMKIPD